MYNIISELTVCTIKNKQSKWHGVLQTKDSLVKK